MPLYRPSELAAFLASIEASPKRTLSQNFLIDGNILSKMVCEAPIGSCVLEIGPGPGALTEALLNAGCRVVAVEKDKKFARALRRLDEGEKRLTIIESDVLECSWTQMVPAGSAIISNLPYHATAPILERLFRAHSHFPKAALMVQEEAARRLKEASSSLLGVLLGCCYDVQYGFSVPKSCFWPKPGVDSAVLLFRERPLIGSVEGEERLEKIVRAAFVGKRKTLLHSLKGFFSREELETFLQRNGLSATARPEEMTVHQWAALVSEGGGLSSLAMTDSVS